MRPIRVIPCLDMRGGRVVKGIQFVQLRDAGDPAEAAKRYSEAGADELVMLDITATVEGRATMLEAVARVAEHVTVPFAVGGGIADSDTMDALLKMGASKVSINSAAVRRPDLIEECARRFGSERVVVAVDAKRCPGGYDVVVSGGHVSAGLDPVEWAVTAQRRGAGEILLTCMDADGAKSGYELPLLKAVCGAVDIPVTASGGAGTLEHFYEAAQAGANGLLAASLFHFGELSIRDVKAYLRARGVPVLAG